jgi:hypothetical protein
MRKLSRKQPSPAMPRYISQHTIACLTRQALEALIAGLRRDPTVKCVRFVSDSLEGKLLCEFEAPDKETVVAYLRTHNMHPQWIMRVEQEL